MLEGSSTANDTILTHVRLSPGDLGTRLATKAEIEGLNYTILAEMADSEAYADVDASEFFL